MKRRRQPVRQGSFFKNLFQSRLTVAIGLVLIAVIGVSLVREINDRRTLSRERQQLEEQVSALEGRNTELSKLIERLQGTDFAEEEARLKLGLKKPGEKVVRIIGKGSGDTTTDGSSNGTDTSLSLSVPARWLHYFFNH